VTEKGREREFGIASIDAWKGGAKAKLTQPNSTVTKPCFEFLDRHPTAQFTTALL